MSLLVLIGGAKAGKSAVAERLALAHEGPVVVAVAGAADDPEMQRRIERHREERPATFTTLEITDLEGWLQQVPPDALLLVECLTTLVGRILADSWNVPDTGTQEPDFVSEPLEEEVMIRVEALVLALAHRRAETIVITNEVGEGLVPAYPMGRLFRDVLGSANRKLVEAADGAWLVVAGRCVDLIALPSTPRWPGLRSRRRRA